jgi:hypothetical protein
MNKLRLKKKGFEKKNLREFNQVVVVHGRVILGLKLYVIKMN